MIHRRLLPVLICAAIPALFAETQSVSVSESNTHRSIEFSTPTETDGVKHAIEISNESTKYEMDKVSVVPDSSSDLGAWVCRISNKSRMLWKITALRATPLAYTVNGGLREVLKSSSSKGRGKGAAKTPDAKAFDVEVPAATALLWSNVRGSHANANAKNRLRIAVGEEVSLSIKNSHLGNPVWSASNGLFKGKGQSTWATSLNHDPEVLWVAPSEPGSVTLTITFPKAGDIAGGQTRTATAAMLTFDVIAPTGESVAKDSADRKPAGPSAIPGVGPWLGGMMTLRYTLNPRDVNFYKTLTSEENTEVATRALDVTGYFAKTGGDPNLLYPVWRHAPSDGWFPCDKQGTFTDIAGAENFASFMENGNYRWESGSFHWDIPAMCRGEDPRGTPARVPGAGTKYAVRTQTFDIAVSPAAGIVGAAPLSVTFTCTKTASDSPAASITNTVSIP